MQTKHVLIVDDEPTVLLTLADSFERMNNAYKVDTCNNGEEALIKVAENDYSLLLTDYSMPGMSGFDLAQAVKERSPKTNIIMMTAYGSKALREKAADLELNGFVDKPFTIKKIHEIINHLAPNAANAAGAPRVLVIEDNADLRRLYSKALTRAGYQITATGLFHEAHDFIIQNRFDVLLCDINIGAERGTDLVREQRAKLEEDHTHVVMITGETWYSDIAEEIGADFLLEKPVALDTLVGLIGRLTMPREA